MERDGIQVMADAPKTDTPPFQQKILFGCPGTGKSHKVDESILTTLGSGSKPKKENVIKCVFHPEYTYGDFMGKLMPLTQSDKVTYRFYPGHFLRALAQAYKNRIDGNNNHVALVIDEINRGNTAAIFGPVIQLLDRDENGDSSYHIDLSDMEYIALTNLIWEEKEYFTTKEKVRVDNRNVDVTSPIDTESRMKVVMNLLNEKNINNGLEEKRIRLPSNISIIGTMNTSDESIYYMDSAFKRRWDWEYVNLTTKGDETKDDKSPVGKWTIGEGDSPPEWCAFVDNLNQFIKNQAKSIRRVEDKQIGYWFIKAKAKEKENNITEDQIKNKLMFFLWDSVFQRDKSPLVELLKVKKDSLVTFGDFTSQYKTFIDKISKYPTPNTEDNE